MIDLASSSAGIARARGRPREFDIDEALDKAVRVFCERGYHATSIGDLMDAMQLASGSVYKAFKDKKAIFLAAFDRYKAVREAEFQRALEAGASGRDKVRKALAVFAKMSCGPEGRQGCLVLCSAAELATFDADVAQRVVASLDAREALLAELIRLGRTDGSIPRGIDAAATARLLLCVLQGMRVIGKTGRTRAQMASIVAVAMKTLA